MIIKNLGGNGALSVISSCWNKLENTYGYKSWTESGESCQNWEGQYPHSHLYPSFPGPYCRYLYFSVIIKIYFLK